MQIQITVEPKQEGCFELAEILHAFATDYENWMISSVKSGRHTLHDEGGELVASLEIVQGAAHERELPLAAHGGPQEISSSAGSASGRDNESLPQNGSGGRFIPEAGEQGSINCSV
jgi:hypothetical protein